MSKSEIDIYINHQNNLIRSKQWKASPYTEGCPDDPNGPLCALIMVELEQGNLYYVNKIWNYDQLLSHYQYIHNEFSKLKTPVASSFKESLKNATKFLASAVAGLITAGPVGLFTGGAAATAKLISDERKRAGEFSDRMLDQAMDDVSAAKQQRQNEQIKKVALISITGLGAGAILYWMFSD